MATELIEIKDKPVLTQNEVLLQDEEDSLRTIEIQMFSKKILERGKKSSLFRHSQGYIHGHIFLTNKISLFRAQVLATNGIICFLIILYMLTFKKNFPTDYMISCCILSILSQLILLLDSYYLYYYKRYPKWIFSFSGLEIFTWIIILLNFSEFLPWVYKPLTHLTLILNPLIYIGLSSYHCYNWNPTLESHSIVGYYANGFRIFWSIYRTLFLMKILDIGMGRVKIWVLFLPLVLYLVAMVIFSLIAFMGYLWDCCRGIGGNNHYSRAFTEIACVSFPICSFFLYFFYVVDSFFEKGEYSVLVLIQLWLIYIIFIVSIFMNRIYKINVASY